MNITVTEKPASRVEVKIDYDSLGRKPILSRQLEDKLMQYCVIMDQSFFGLTRKDVQRMAFQLAIRNNIPHPFSANKKRAGRKWLKAFKRRHPLLSFRQPQPISIARAQGFTKEAVAEFFRILRPEMVKINFRPNRVFNVDETGITVVQHKSEKVRFS